MKKNIGAIDRRVRIILGLTILAIGLVLGSWWGLVGLVLLATAAVRWCPLYLPLGLSTAERDTVTASME